MFVCVCVFVCACVCVCVSVCVWMDYNNGVWPANTTVAKTLTPPIGGTNHYFNQLKRSDIFFFFGFIPFWGEDRENYLRYQIRYEDGDAKTTSLPRYYPDR